MCSEVNIPRNVFLLPENRFYLHFTFAFIGGGIFFLLYEFGGIDAIEIPHQILAQNIELNIYRIANF